MQWHAPARAPPARAPIEWAVSLQVLGIPARVEPTVLDAVRRAHPDPIPSHDMFVEEASVWLVLSLGDLRLGCWLRGRPFFGCWRVLSWPLSRASG